MKFLISTTKQKPFVFTIVCFVSILFITTLLLSLTYLSFVGSARSMATESFSRIVAALFHRLETHFQHTLNNVNIISLAMANFCSISNATFVQFNNDLRQLHNGNATKDSDFVSFPTRVLWAKIVSTSEINGHVQEIQTEVKNVVILASFFKKKGTMKGFQNYSIFEYDAARRRYNCYHYGKQSRSRRFYSERRRIVSTRPKRLLSSTIHNFVGSFGTLMAATTSHGTSPSVSIRIECFCLRMCSWPKIRVIYIYRF
jgi:hypothetical protein